MIRKAETDPNTLPLSRFIPFLRADLVEMCIARNELTDDQPSEFRELAKMIQSIFHFEFHESLESLKLLYTPIDPNAQTKNIQGNIRPIESEEEKEESLKEFVRQLTTVLNDANYEKVEREELENALNRESLFSIKLEINFDEFSQYLFFKRGISHKKETVRPWYFFGKKEIEFETYDRVVLFVKFKDDSHFEQSTTSPPLFSPGTAILKMFQNVPVDDVEMLFPNTQVRMRTIDKLFIGIPTAIGGLLVLVTKLGASIVIIAGLILFAMGIREEQPEAMDGKQILILASGLGALGAFLFRQWGNFKNRKLGFLKTLTENLYFRNLDNNMGVIFRLINGAEEEEGKEALLAYYFLLTNQQGLTKAEIDLHIENWLEEKFDCVVNFEIDDALQKLVRLGIADHKDGKFHCKPMQQSMQILDTVWDNYFQYNVSTHQQ